MTAPQTRETSNAGRLVQLIVALMLVVWLTVTIVAALSLDGAAAAVVTAVLLVGGAVIGWMVRRRALARAAERTASALSDH